MKLDLLFLVLFWVSGLALVHTYFSYPLSLKFLTYFIEEDQVSGTEPLPSVALIIAAYNEEDIIREKIENSLELAYPDELLNIVVFSDASDDRTDEIVKEYEDRGVSLVRIEGRVGKTECQNETADRVDESILVFSDANSMYDPDAITRLVEKFDQGVGCVAGELRYRGSSDVEGESTYWRYESAIKRLESQVHSLVTGNGAIYAVRAESYVPLPQDAISDFAEPLSIVRNGEVVKYAPDAIAWEETETSVSSELQRRIRIVTRCWHTIADNRDLLNLFSRPLFSYELWSHKVLRWLSPVFLILVLVGNIGLVALTDSPLYQLGLLGQSVFYALATAGLLADRLSIDDVTITHVPFYFLQSTYGMFIGLLNFLQGKNIVVWETSDRE